MLVRNHTAAFVNLASAAAEHPHDAQVQDMMRAALEDLDLHLRVRSALRARLP